jgi:hypothetical protein
MTSQAMPVAPTHATKWWSVILWECTVDGTEVG